MEEMRPVAALRGTVKSLGVYVILALLISACGQREPELGSAENPIVIAFTPSGVQEEVVAGMEVVERLLEEATGYSIEASFVGSKTAAVEALCSGQAQVGHEGPFDYIVAHERCGVEPLAVMVRGGSDTYGTQMITRADSGITSLADLEGKKACWNDPLSASGYVVPQGLVGEAVPLESLQEPVWTGSHASTVSSLYEGGICDFGFTWIDARATIEGDNPDVKEVVHVAFSSEAFIPNDLFVARPDLDPTIRQAILEALIALPESEEGKAAYDRLYQIEGLVERDDSFFDRFRVVLDASGINIEELFE